MEKAFDINEPIRLKVIRPEGDAVISIKFPSDSQWIERSGRRKSKDRSLGNGKTQSIPSTSDPRDAELINSLRVGEGPDVDMYEAQKILEKISSVTYGEDPVRDGQYFRVSFVARGAELTHLIRVPTEADQAEFRRMASIPSIQQGNIVTYGFNLGAAADSYNKLCKEQTGYAGAVPIVHKLAAIHSAFEAVDKLTMDDDENP